MNAWFDAAEPWRQLTGWTMLHVLWVGTAVALVGGAVRVACRRRTPGVKYAASLGTLAVLAATPFAVAGWLRQNPQWWDATPIASELTTSPGRDPSASPRERVAAATDATTRESLTAGGPAPHDAEAPGRVIDLKYDQNQLAGSRGNPSPNSEDLANSPGTPSLAVRESQGAAEEISNLGSQSLDRAAPAPLTQLVSWLPLAWIIGAPITFGWLATGLVGSRRLRSTSMAIDSGPIADACRRIAASLGVARRIAVAACDRLAQPVLVGIVRPTILLPAAALSGWSPEELEMILMHELAHVRRWDNLVNLGQRIVEATLFFHPAVWLVSRQVRRDREECCDAIVVGRTNRPEAYASLLVSIAAAMRSQRSPSLTAASTLVGHPLAARIRRILKLEDETMRVSRGTVGAAAALLLALVASACLMPTSGGAAADETQSDAAATSSDESVRITKVYPVGDMKSVDFAAWLRINASSRDDADFGLDEFARSMVVTGPPHVHEQIAALLNREREKSSTNVLLNSNTADAANVADVQTVLDAMRRELRAKLKQLAAMESKDGNASAAELELSKLRNDITMFQTQILKLNEALTQLEADKSVAVIDAQSPGVLEMAVQAEMDNDKTIGTYKEQLFQLSQAIQALQDEERNGDSAQMKRLHARHTQIEQTLEQYKLAAEKLVRARLEKTPNQALRAAYTMYKVKTERYLAEKKMLEDKVTYAEEQIAELSVIDPGITMLQQDIEALRRIIAALEKNLAEWRGRRIERIGEKNRLVVPFPPQTSDVEARRMAAELKEAGHDAKAIREGGELFLELLTDVDAPRVVFEESMVDGQRRVAARVVGKGTPPEETRMRYEESDESGQFIQVDSAAEVGELNSQAANAVSGDAPAVSGPFLSLEEQRVADRAYKALGWELEPLDENDLVRAKQLGFEGGLRIVDTTNQNGPGQFGDLLVGLHIWPVKDFKTLEAVLARSDVAELSPMKYYLVRFESGGGRGGNRKNRVATGRATVLAPTIRNDREQIDARDREANAGFNPYSSPNSPSSGRRTPYRLNIGDLIIVRVAGAAPDEPIDGQFVIEDEGTIALGPIYGRIPVAGLTVVEAEAAIVEKLKKILREPRVQVTLMAKAGPGPAIYPSAGDLSSPGPTFDPTAEDLSTTYPPADEGSRDATYVYDGKTFAQWRDEWKSELKIERRSQAVDALAAFARVGYGREAAEALLDVAGEYDFRTIDGSPEGKLKQRIVVLFTSSGEGPVAARDWLPVLKERLANDTQKWGPASRALLNRLYGADEATQDNLLQMARDPRYGPNAAALRALVRSTPEGDSDWDAVEQLIRDALAGADSENALAVLSWHSFKKIDDWPEAFALFFHADPAVRRSTRILLKRGRVLDSEREDYQAIVDKLLAVLADGQRTADHQDAIRGLAVMERYIVQNAELRQRIVSRLTEALHDGGQSVLPAAYAALRRLATAKEIAEIGAQLPQERKALVATAAKESSAEWEQIDGSQPSEARGQDRDGSF